MYIDVALWFCKVYVTILRHCYVILWSQIDVYVTLEITIIWMLHTCNMDVRMYTLHYIYVIWTLELGWDYVDLMSYYYFFTKCIHLFMYKWYQWPYKYENCAWYCIWFYFWPTFERSQNDRKTLLLLVGSTKHAEGQYPTCQERSQALQFTLSWA